MCNRLLVGLITLPVLFFPAYGRPKPHYTFVLPDRYVGWIQAVFNDRDALPLPIRKDGGRQIDVPASGIPRTSDMHVNDDRAKDEFYYRIILPDGRSEFRPVPAEYVMSGFAHGGFTMMDTDGKGPGSSWYLFVGPPELRAKVPLADWPKVVEEYAKTHGGKKRVEFSGPYPTPGNMAGSAEK